MMPFTYVVFLPTNDVWSMNMGAFPSPAQDYAEHRMDLYDFLVIHPTATFFVHDSRTP